MVEKQILNTQKCVTTTVENIQEQIVFVRQCTEPIQKVKYIFKDAKTDLPSGAKSDSIYFEIFFEDLEGATGIPSDRLIVSGYRRTGFLEDEP